jgi:hypothetical protein
MLALVMVMVLNLNLNLIHVSVFFFNLSIGYLSGVRRFLSILYVFRVVVSIRVWSKEV